MHRLLILMAAAVVAGCGPAPLTECDQARQTLGACGVPGSSLSPCEGANLTYARCVNSNQSVVCAGLSNSRDLTNAFNKCISSLSSP